MFDKEYGNNGDLDNLHERNTGFTGNGPDEEGYHDSEVSDHDYAGGNHSYQGDDYDNYEPGQYVTDNFDRGESEKEDFFDKAPEPEAPKKKKEKKPVIYPDDPRYYEQEESYWEHLKPRRKKRMLITAVSLFVLILMLWGAFIYLFKPCVSDAEQYGYVENIEHRGKLFNTFEGVLLPYKQIKDTTRVYEGDFVFSIANDHVAAKLRLLQHSGRPVGVIYKKYNIPYPWRGESKIIVDSVFDVDPSTLLPPDKRPEVP